MKDEALKKAEHALEGVLQVPEKISMMHILEVVRFIREAREEKQQEPVATLWQQAPIRTTWGDEMMVASVAIDNDHTLSLYCERDQTPKVDAMFAQRKPLTDEEIESMWIGSVGFLNPMLNQHTRLAFTRAIEAAHGIKK